MSMDLSDKQKMHEFLKLFRQHPVPGFYHWFCPKKTYNLLAAANLPQDQYFCARMKPQKDEKEGTILYLKRWKKCHECKQKLNYFEPHWTLQVPLSEDGS